MVTTMHRSLFVFVAYCLALTAGDICTRPTSKPNNPAGTEPVMDHIPTFSADIEIYKQEDAALIATKLYYDQVSNNIRWSSLENTFKTDQFFYYTDDEVLIVQSENPQVRGTCSTINQDMHKSPITFKVGGSSYDSINRIYTVPPVLNVFHFSGVDAKQQQIYPQYAGKKVIRGKDVYAFTSCQSWNFLEDDFRFMTAKVTHYFTQYKDTANWKYPYAMTIPVAMLVESEYQGGKKFNQTWNFFNVKPSIVPSGIFETPDGVVCPQRKADTPFPDLPNFVKLTYEVINHKDPSYRVLDEIYDNDAMFGMVKSSKQPSSVLDQGRIVTIDYFPFGLSFQIDEQTKHCSIQNITSRQVPFYTNNNGIAQFYNPKMFFTAADSKFVYLGQKTVRGMPCDVWTGSSYNANTGNVTVEWYFASKQTITWNSNSNEAGYRIPVRCKLWPQSNQLMPGLRLSDPYLDFNVYHVDFTKTLINFINIKPCLSGSPSNVFKIVFQNAAAKARITNKQVMEWTLLQSLSSLAGVDWIRISDLRMYTKNSDYIFTFELLDAPPYAGDVQVRRKMLTLNAATAKLTKAITSGKVKLTLTAINSNSKVTFTASTKVSAGLSYQTGTSGTGMSGRNLAVNAPYNGKNNDSGYSGGAMAGLGIAMLAIGLASGGGSSYYLIYKKGYFA